MSFTPRNHFISISSITQSFYPIFLIYHNRRHEPSKTQAHFYRFSILSKLPRTIRVSVSPPLLYHMAPMLQCRHIASTCGSRRQCSIAPHHHPYCDSWSARYTASLAVRKPFLGPEVNSRWARTDAFRHRCCCCGVAVGVKFSFISRLYICLFSRVRVCLLVVSVFLSFIQQQNQKYKINRKTKK